MLVYPLLPPSFLLLHETDSAIGPRHSSVEKRSRVFVAGARGSAHAPHFGGPPPRWIHVDHPLGRAGLGTEAPRRMLGSPPASGPINTDTEGKLRAWVERHSARISLREKDGGTKTEDLCEAYSTEVPIAHQRPLQKKAIRGDAAQLLPRYRPPYQSGRHCTGGSSSSFAAASNLKELRRWSRPRGPSR